ncbi:BH0509 family protein [Listeria monocytogenes]|nr:BH0509 family protein [Listeria monocytogenes]MDB03023.1 BH0509 family protein [Listeria monocytogenes]MDB35367.1 BH0509 family protein [Listeria monocytogenes]
MTINKELEILSKRKLEVQHMINAIAEVTNISLEDLVYMGDEEIESKYTAYVINEATEYAK